jgi:putative hydrolase of the HAD superfamily
MGGTLDGDGLHWLDRFAGLYASAGVLLPRDTLRAAFDTAERHAAIDEAIASAGLEDMIDRHVGWQFAYLSDREQPVHPLLKEQFVRAFAGSIREVAETNRRVLADLKTRGLELGVVSNGCGNVDVLCSDLGYAPFLSLVVDSRRVGLYKPDPAIYVYAAGRVGLPPSSIMMVGDSFDRDVVPARSIGMKAAWLQGFSGRTCPDASQVDVTLPALTDLPAAIAALAVAKGTAA